MYCQVCGLVVPDPENHSTCWDDWMERMDEELEGLDDVTRLSIEIMRMLDVLRIGA